MDKYEINYFFNEDNNLNDLLIKVLNQELKQYFEKINNIKKNKIASSQYDFSKQEIKIARSEQ
mgnify:FL=1